MFRLNLVWKWRCLYCFVLFPWKQLCCHPMMKSLLISWIVYDTSVIRLLHEVNHTVSFSMWLVFIAIGFIFCLFFIWCHNCNPESCIVIIVTSWICLWYVRDYAFTWSKTVSCHFLCDWCSVSAIFLFQWAGSLLHDVKAYFCRESKTRHDIQYPTICLFFCVIGLWYPFFISMSRSAFTWCKSQFFFIPARHVMILNGSSGWDTVNGKWSHYTIYHFNI